MPVIKTSGGRLIDYPEGVLSSPKSTKKVYPHVDRRPRVGQDQRKIVFAETPWLTRWRSKRQTDLSKLGEKAKPFSRGVGVTKRAFAMALKKATRLAKADMTEIKKKIILSEAAEEALEMSLVIMRAQVGAGEKLKAARQVLEYTMAKPVAKSEVTVSTAEDWLKTLKDD